MRLNPFELLIAEFKSTLAHRRSWRSCRQPTQTYQIDDRPDCFCQTQPRAMPAAAGPSLRLGPRIKRAPTAVGVIPWTRSQGRSDIDSSSVPAHQLALTHCVRVALTSTSSLRSRRCVTVPRRLTGQDPVFISGLNIEHTGQTAGCFCVMGESVRIPLPARSRTVTPTF